MTDPTDIDAIMVRRLAALGHATRLAVYRLLVRAGPEGATVGEIAARVGGPASTLSHHLAALVDAGLVEQERQGRTIRCRADYAAMRATVARLTEDCCTGLTLTPTDTGDAA